MRSPWKWLGALVVLLVTVQWGLTSTLGVTSVRGDILNQTPGADFTRWRTPLPGLVMVEYESELHRPVRVYTRATYVWVPGWWQWIDGETRGPFICPLF